MSSTDYITEQEFLDYIKSPADTGNAVVQGAISAASRAVDSYCDRFFYQVDTAQTAYFSGCHDYSAFWWLDIDDLASTTDLAVHADTAMNGTYTTTLTLNTDFILEPVNQVFANSIIGYPYTALRAKQMILFPLRYFPWQPDTVKITGIWGWAAVPDPVKQATKIIAAQFYKLADAPLGVAGWGAFGDIKVRDIPQAATLLNPYRRGSAHGVA